MSHRQKPPFSNLDEIVEVFEAMPRIGIGHNGYSDADRSHDFMCVLNGDSTAEQGRRVLAQIADYCNPAPDPDASSDRRAFNDGRRSVFVWLNRCMAVRSDVEVQRSPKP